VAGEQDLRELTVRRGQQVEVLKVWAFGVPARWFGGYTYVKADPRGGYLVRVSEGHFKGAVMRYPTNSVRPARLRKNDQYSPLPPAEHFDPEQLRVGTKIEAGEHGLTQAQGRKVALDHLKEDPNYYTKLAKMEKGTPLWGWDKLFTY
jgi:hypothetical protein